MMNVRMLLVLMFCAVAFSSFAADTDVDIAVPAHDIARGSVIQENDLDYKTVPVSRASTGVIRLISDAAGKETRRTLKAGDILRASDLKRRTLVAKGSTVTMLFEAPGMQLTALGRALEEGADGDTITVLNPTSYRKVEAVVIKSGTVRVGASSASISEAVAAAQP